MRLTTAVITLFGALQQSSALTAAQWKQQSIYQVLTDRFARTDGSTTASCNINNYCGGTWQGIINKLDYIQGMGFTAVCIHRPSLP
jgi:alpha-amylase